MPSILTMKRFLLPVRPLAAMLVAATFLAIGAIVAAAPTAAAERAVLTPDAQADLKRIEAYLNNLTTLDSRFVQLSEDGIAEGRLRLSRPDQLRIDYSPPVPVHIVANGLVVMYHDRELDQTSFIPVFETPIYFLLRDRIDLTDGLEVTNFEREASVLRVTLIETKNPDAGQITIVFEDRPLRLVKWRAIDAQGNAVDVALVDTSFGVAFEDEDEMFSTVDPESNRTFE